MKLKILARIVLRQICTNKICLIFRLLKMPFCFLSFAEDSSVPETQKMTEKQVYHISRIKEGFNTDLSSDSEDVISQIAPVQFKRKIQQRHE